jgi:hypothetical protein
MDISYVGSESHRLTTRSDWDPRLPVGTLRLHPDYGPVVVKTSAGNSSYHALQAQLTRRFSRGYEILASYTWSKTIDSTSDGVGNTNVQDPSGGNLTSVPVIYGGMKVYRAVSDFDRPQRLTIASLWAVPGPRAGWSKYPLGGWQLAGVTTFQSGTPFSVANGFDRTTPIKRTRRISAIPTQRSIPVRSSTRVVRRVIRTPTHSHALHRVACIGSRGSVSLIHLPLAATRYGPGGPTTSI